MKILIAEDDTLFLRLLTELLSSEFEVIGARDGLAALGILLQEQPPTMAVLDWVMPGMTGPELCRELRANPRTAENYLILLTAKNDSADITAGLRAGADDYITKPFVAEELWARVRIGRRILELQGVVSSQAEALTASCARETSIQARLNSRTDAASPVPALWPL